ncbi:hypothetical protein B0O80DRAFT_427803 [Mortierella sp. GBAus27b]|nr:hypothetical protein B0O80DRAFT_427803 [Mortierella sp. GBAus27b]
MTGSNAVGSIQLSKDVSQDISPASLLSKSRKASMRFPCGYDEMYPYCQSFHSDEILTRELLVMLSIHQKDVVVKEEPYLDSGSNVQAYYHLQVGCLLPPEKDQHASCSASCSARFLLELEVSVPEGCRRDPGHQGVMYLEMTRPRTGSMIGGCVKSNSRKAIARKECTPRKNLQQAGVVRGLLKPGTVGVTHGGGWSQEQFSNSSHESWKGTGLRATSFRHEVVGVCDGVVRTVIRVPLRGFGLGLNTDSAKRNSSLESGRYTRSKLLRGNQHASSPRDQYSWSKIARATHKQSMRVQVRVPDVSSKAFITEYLSYRTDVGSQQYRHRLVPGVIRGPLYTGTKSILIHVWEDHDSYKNEIEGAVSVQRPSFVASWAAGGSPIAWWSFRRRYRDLAPQLPKAFSQEIHGNLIMEIATVLS